MKDRELTDVINAMLDVIPAEQTNLRFKIERIRDSALFTAPEAMRERWFDVASVLQSFIGDDPTKFTDWQRQVLQLWVGKGASI